jgi:hypothetical protein
MDIESIQKFTPPAVKLWDAIPVDTRKSILANVWCGKCSHGVTIMNFSGTVKGGDLLLSGSCSECQGPLARLIEVERTAARPSGGAVRGNLKLTVAQALLEVKEVQKEFKAFEKRRTQLSKKWKAESITKQEKAEMDRLYGKDGDAMVDRLLESAEKLAEANTKKR